MMMWTRFKDGTTRLVELQFPARRQRESRTVLSAHALLIEGSEGGGLTSNLQIKRK